MNQAFEPETLYCTPGECLEEAAVTGYAMFQVGGPGGAADHQRRLTFTLPLCEHHAHLLRSEGSFVEFYTDELKRDGV
jgi:hypothetical protein